MGILRNYFSLICGTICGIYIGQNYNVPRVKKVITDARDKLIEIEAKRRKPDA